jgi:hypothetical protein
MKNTVLLFAFSFFFLLAATSFSQTATKANDPSLLLKIADNHGQKVVQVSFDGVDAPTGQLEITNAAGRVMLLMEIFEIVKNPYYATINVSEFSSGDYIFTLKTKIRSYSSTITVQ